MKIAVIGYSGAGKSTLAKALGERYGAEVLYLDQVHWLPGWRERPADEEEKLAKAFMDSRSGWVIDGNYEKFDQARRLAVCLSRRLGVPCLSLIRRPAGSVRGAGREQKKLNADQRKTNAATSYVLADDASSRLSGRFVVLVDDLCTTGATLSACSALLTSAGASGVLWATVTRTASRK